ncbi:MAG: hypothetical protein J1E99_03425 [Muribaculaceae bacterium]|nr:hypothetical protein [Muribaculaceae bacterium]
MGPGNFLHDNLSVKNDGPKFAVTTMAKGPETRKQHKKHKIINLSYMKTNSLTKWLGLAILPAALAFTSCIEDKLSNDPVTPDSPSTPGVTEAPISTASYNIQGGDQSRVTYYGTYSSRHIDGFEMPQIPSESEIQGNNPTELSNFDSNKSYFIVTDKFEGWVNAPNQPSTLYVKGDFKGGFNGGTWTIYILEGASFEIQQDNIASGIKLYNWGDFSTSGNFSLNTDPLFSANDVYINGMLTCPSGAQYYCQGTTFAKNIYVNSGASVESCAFIVGDGNNITVDQWGSFSWGAPGVVEFAGGNLNFHTSYLKAEYLKFNSNNNLHLTLEDKGRIEVAYLQVDHKQKDQKIVTLGDKAVVTANTVILGQQFQQNEEKILPNFGEGVYLQDVEFIRENGNDNSPSGYRIPTGGEINREDLSMKGANCSPGYNGGEGEDDPEDKPEEPKGPELILKSGIAPNHDHNNDKGHGVRKLSATCITSPDGTNFYASFHMRGDNYDHDIFNDQNEGCIEAWEVNDDGEVVMKQWMWLEDFDFNHLIVDGNSLVTVGHNYKDGAIIGRLPRLEYISNYPDNKDNVEIHNDFEYAKVYSNVRMLNDSNQMIDYYSAGDANCLIREGQYYYVASSWGFSPVTVDSLKPIRVAGEPGTRGTPLFVNSPNDGGSVKHVIKTNNGVAFLALDTPFNDIKETDSSEAHIYSYNTSGIDLFSQSVPAGIQVTDGNNIVNPVDGKNVIAENKGYIYSCLSHGGLARVPVNGGNVERWQRIHTSGENKGQKSHIPVNGVAFDNDYIYVANGSFLSVLDQDLNEVAYYHDNDENSANYVYVADNGLIFVAYGQSGVKVFELKNR